MNTPPPTRSCVLVLNNIRSVHNVGSLLRTADAAGVSRVVLVGYTPAPIDRFGRKRADLAKVALGAELSVSWSQEETLLGAVAKLHAEGHVILALEQAPQSVSLFEYKTPEQKPMALILGSEPEGLSQEELSLADTVLEIPMSGKKESLNVSVAGGIALFVLLKT